MHHAVHVLSCHWCVQGGHFSRPSHSILSQPCPGRQQPEGMQILSHTISPALDRPAPATPLSTAAAQHACVMMNLQCRCIACDKASSAWVGGQDGSLSRLTAALDEAVEGEASSQHTWSLKQQPVKGPMQSYTPKASRELPRLVSCLVGHTLFAPCLYAVSPESLNPCSLQTCLPVPDTLWMSVKARRALSPCPSLLLA